MWVKKTRFAACLPPSAALDLNQLHHLAIVLDARLADFFFSRCSTGIELEARYEGAADPIGKSHSEPLRRTAPQDDDLLPQNQVLGFKGSLATGTTR
jgi:hypothetical protein